MTSSPHHHTPYCVIGGGIVGCLLGLIAPTRTLVCDPNMGKEIQKRTPIAVSRDNMLWLADILNLELASLLKTTEAIPVSHMRVSFGSQYIQLDNDTDARAAYIINHGALSQVVEQKWLAHKRGFAWRYHAHTSEQNKHSVTTDAGTISAKILLAADGARSCVQLIDNPPMVEVPCAHTALVAEVTLAYTEKTQTAWQLFAQHIIGMLPLDVGCHTAALIWSMPDADAHRLVRQGTAFLQAEYNQMAQGALPAIVHCSEPKLFSLQQNYVAQWKRVHTPTIAYFGDAAHSVHPLAGQGLNLAIQEARLWQTLVTKHTSDVAITRDFHHQIKNRTLPIIHAIQALYRTSGWHGSIRKQLYKLLALGGGLL